MANEFKVKNGLIVDAGGAQITGGITGSTDFNTIVNKPTLISSSAQFSGDNITGSNLRATSAIVSPNISYTSQLSSNGGEIRISQTQYRGGNNITFVYSATTDSNGSRDLGFRRNTSGSLEIYDGNNADGAVANRRDLILRDITGSNATFSGSFNITGSLTASLQQGYTWVGNANNTTVLVATSSFGGSATIPAGTVSGSSQISLAGTSDYTSLFGGIGASTSSLNTFSASNFTSQLNSFTSSAANRLTNLETTTSSLNISISSLNTYSASVSNSIQQLNSYSASVSNSIQQLNTFTASNANTSLNAATASFSPRITNLETTSASVNISVSNLNTFTASNANTSLNTYTGSNDTTNTSQNSRLTNLETTSASVNISVTSLNTVTSSLATTYEGRASTTKTIFSGSSQVTFTQLSGISSGIISSSAQTVSSISGQNVSLGQISASADLVINTTGTTTSAPRIVGFSPLPASTAVEVRFGDAFTALRSGNAQRMQFLGYWGIELFGNRQSTATSYAAGSASDPALNIYGTQTGAPVLATTATSGQTANIHEWRNSSNVPLVAVSSAGAISGSSNAQFSSLGVGMVASGTAGRIDANGDIVAFSTSDKNFKENIVPIQNALEKISKIPETLEK